MHRRKYHPWVEYFVQTPHIDLRREVGIRWAFDNFSLFVLQALDFTGIANTKAPTPGRINCNKSPANSHLFPYPAGEGVGGVGGCIDRCIS